MQDCQEAVVNVYSHPDLLNLISKIRPENIRDDLRQEIAVSLLEQPCDTVAALFAGDNLLRYSMKICWLMATSKTSPFYYKYKKSDFTKAVAYLHQTQSLPEIPISLAYHAKEVLSKKNKNINEDHEVRIFNKYVELGSSRAVARYYQIPLNHVCNVVNKIKTELRCLLLQ